MRKIRGNILFLILLAVALFTALTYAVISSIRGGGKDASSESATTSAAQLVQYATLMEQTVQRLMLVNDCKETQLSFQYDENNDGLLTSGGDPTYYNPNNPSNYRCFIYHPDGGNLHRETPSAALTTKNRDYVVMGRHFVNNIGTTCIQDTCTDLVLTLRNVPDDLCRAINRLANGLNSIPQEDDNNFPSLSFKGAFGPRADEIAATGVLNSASTGCVYADGVGSTGFGNAFFHVLLAR